MAADTKLSKSLAYVLRHQAHKLGFKVYPDLLAHKLFRRYTLLDIERVVAADTKKRYSFKDDADLGLKLLAANQGHSFQVEAPEITEVTDAGQFPVVVHGTYLKNWPQIKKQGLNRMGRTHIHFAQGEPADSEVISGMRNSCQVMIFINLKKALDDGFKFYLSKNGVILCPGDDSGSLSLTTFLKSFKDTQECDWILERYDTITAELFFLQDFQGSWKRSCRIDVNLELEEAKQV